MHWTAGRMLPDGWQEDECYKVHWGLLPTKKHRGSFLGRRTVLYVWGKVKTGLRYKWRGYSIDRCHLCFTDKFAHAKIVNENKDKNATHASHDVPELKEYEVQAFILENYYNLTFSPSVETSLKSKSTNPKRIQREVMKVYRRAAGREERKAEQERKRELKQQKRKQKHRGR